jgi:hypothetical protein
VTLGEGVRDAVPHDVGDDDEEGEGVAEMLPDTLTDQLPVGVRLPLPLTVAVSKELWETLWEGEAVVVYVGKWEPLSVTDTVPLGLEDTLGDMDKEAVPHWEGLGVGVVEAQPEALCTPEEVSVSVAEELEDCEVIGEGEGDWDAEVHTVGVKLGDWDGLVEDDTEGEVDKVGLELEQ